MGREKNAEQVEESAECNGRSDNHDYLRQAINDIEAQRPFVEPLTATPLQSAEEVAVTRVGRETRRVVCKHLCKKTHFPECVAQPTSNPSTCRFWLLEAPDGVQPEISQLFHVLHGACAFPQDKLLLEAIAGKQKMPAKRFEQQVIALARLLIEYDFDLQKEAVCFAETHQVRTPTRVLNWLEAGRAGYVDDTSLRDPLIEPFLSHLKREGLL